jgi:hypothetical protein
LLRFARNDKKLPAIAHTSFIGAADREIDNLVYELYGLLPFFRGA